MIDFVYNGGSKAEAARRFQVGIHSVFYWLKQGRNYRPEKPGPRNSFKLDRNKLVQLVKKNSDMTLKELARDILEHPDAYQYERARRFGVSVQPFINVRTHKT